MRRLKKKIYLGLCGTVVAALAVVRACNPNLAEPLQSSQFKVHSSQFSHGERQADSTVHSSQLNVQTSEAQPDSALCTVNYELATKVAYHPIRSVHSYQDCFPDVQDVQILAARKWGVRPVRNREQAEERKSELVYVGSNPYYVMDKGMSHSIPYLVPRAALLLQDIGRSYLDSLAIKGVPLHRIIVTSVLRSEEDVARLLQKNGNASDQSCHRFGTTFDICYNRYNTVQPPGERRREVQNDTLKWVLSEVLRDIREQGRCYIKYEVKQGCFHITTR